MTNTPIYAELLSRALISVSGPDWRSFLQGLLTQDVETLSPGEARLAGLLTPQGRLLWDLFVMGRPDGAWLDVAREHREAIVQRLSLYRLRAKVEIGLEEAAVSALFEAQDPPPPGEVARSAGGGFHSDAADSRFVEASERKPPRSASPTAPPKGEHLWIQDPRLPALGQRGYAASTPEDAEVADEAAYDAHRLALGVPGPADWGAEKTYPIEANFDLLHGIDFRKGCFVGQETTSRMKRRGQIKNRMLPIAFDGPPPAFGAEVLAGTLRAGEVLAGVEGRAMALLRLDRIGGELTVDGKPVRVERPGWMAEALGEDA
ncbi:MAG TPA: folate-binding protein YgfZ [Phenylobacterium sp.]|uniref:CAF17-like 4Fe-4S cluster assembly/insertion protein YgfZ n=1 Tax=Phenylobacterium sp. TaxID=1871053 RepID=UPI002B489E46|nr:folate-binding protein YgfZ [Phenylobacterium sp.]HKR87558.1 folate-binding protein YgfZ [Phenylobacterium sp.]